MFCKGNTFLCEIVLFSKGNLLKYGPEVKNLIYIIGLLGNGVSGGVEVRRREGGEGS